MSENDHSAANLELMRGVMLDMGLSAKMVDALMAGDDNLQTLCDSAFQHLLLGSKPNQLLELTRGS